MTSITFRLSGSLPSGKNAIRITRNGHRYPQARFTTWRTEALHALKVQLRGQRLPIEGPVSLLVDYVPGDQRRRDLPGMCDALCHLLEKAGVLLDDAQVVNMVWNGFPAHKTGSGAVITLRAIP